MDDNLRLPISDLLTAFKRKIKSRLMVSTADVVSYRDAPIQMKSQVLISNGLQSQTRFIFR